jgi:SAM-dependent methyltransferase
MEAIYERPAVYDLEHEGDDQDVRFFIELARRLGPRRILELGSGSGRLTIPLARQGRTAGYEVVGLELAAPMRESLASKVVAGEDLAVDVVAADMRSWIAPEPFDLIVSACSSVTHLLTLEDQLAAWQTARRNLRAGGRFVVDVVMADLRTCAESFQRPPRALVELDIDASDPDSSSRLLRYKTTRYLAHEQRARIHFLYDRMEGADTAERFVSDFEAHVFFPRELQLLYLATGFAVEAVYGDYNFGRLRHGSTTMIVVGRATTPSSAD